MRISQDRIADFLNHRDFELECYFAAMMADPEWRERASKSPSGDDLASILAAFIEFKPDAGKTFQEQIKGFLDDRMRHELSQAAAR